MAPSWCAAPARGRQCIRRAVQSSAQFDDALALLLPSMLVEPWIDERPQAAFNVLPDVFRHHRVATLRSWQGKLPVEHLAQASGQPEEYRTDLSFAAAQAIRGIGEVLSSPDLQSLPLPAADHPHFIYVIAPIRPVPDLQGLAQRVRASEIPGTTFDTTVGFAGIGYPLEATTEEVPITVVSLLPVTSTITELKAFIRGDCASQRPLALESLRISEPRTALANGVVRDAVPSAAGT